MVLQIQVMMPCVSAQRHPDQQCTMFILNLPVVIVAVPAGSLPSALSLAGLPSMPRSERKKRKQNLLDQIGRYVGARSIVVVITQKGLFCKICEELVLKTGRAGREMLKYSATTSIHHQLKFNHLHVWKHFSPLAPQLLLWSAVRVFEKC